MCEGCKEKNLIKYSEEDNISPVSAAAIGRSLFMLLDWYNLRRQTLHVLAGRGRTHEVHVHTCSLFYVFAGLMHANFFCPALFGYNEAFTHGAVHSAHIANYASGML